MSAATASGAGLGRPISTKVIVQENSVLRSAICEAIDRLGEIHDDGQDVEVLIAGIRDDLFRVLEDTAECGDEDEAPIPTLDDIELSYIRLVLEKHGGNKPLAARALGISLKTIYNKLNQAQAMTDLRARSSR